MKFAIRYLSLLTLLWPLATAAHDEKKEEINVDYVRAHYTKYEHMVPMRDGMKLFTAVYTPMDISKRYPFLMMRTPYSVRPYGVDFYPQRLGPSKLFTSTTVS